VRGSSRSRFELVQQIFENGARSLRHIVVPVPHHAKTLGSQSSFSNLIPFRSMLTSVDLNDNASMKTRKI